MAWGIGVIGAGTVGGGVIETLLKHRSRIAEKSGVDLELVHVADANPSALRQFDLTGVTTSTDAATLLADPKVDIVCELVGGIEPARTFILRALAGKKHVVTANKRLLAFHGEELSRAAQEAGVDLRFEAAVAGAIPIIKAVRESLAADHIKAVYGIVNGTCNYILSRMTFEDMEFEEALALAQRNGFAETPPDLDIDGHDAAHKAQILASLAHCAPVPLHSVYMEGIRQIRRLDVRYAEDMGYHIKLLAIVRHVDGELEVRVHPTLVPKQHLLAAVRNEFNAIYVESEIAGATLHYGRGAGRFPTASAVIGDLIDIARCEGKPLVPPFRYAHTLPIRDMGLLTARYYLRFTTQDHPGVLGKICTVLGNHGVSIASCLQKEEHEGEPAHIVMLTHRTVESSVSAALAEINAMDVILEPTQRIRVL